MKTDERKSDRHAVMIRREKNIDESISESHQIEERWIKIGTLGFWPSEMITESVKDNLSELSSTSTMC